MKDPRTWLKIAAVNAVIGWVSLLLASAIMIHGRGPTHDAYVEGLPWRITQILMVSGAFFTMIAPSVTVLVGLVASRRSKSN